MVMGPLSWSLIETLKNLVLSGIGSLIFLIPDEHADRSELTGNYFSVAMAAPASIEHARSEPKPCSRILRQLMALNAAVHFSVHYYAHEGCLFTILASLALPVEFVLLGESGLSASFMARLYDVYVRHGSSSVWIVGSFGLLGTLEYHAKRLLVLNQRSEHHPHDLMLREPAPAMLAYYQSCAPLVAASLEPESIESVTAQFPLPVVVYHLYQRYQQRHEGLAKQDNCPLAQGWPLFSAWLSREYAHRLSPDFFKVASHLESENPIPDSLVQVFCSLQTIGEAEIALDADLRILQAIQSFCRQHERAPSPEPSDLPDYESESHVYLDWVQACRRQFEEDLQAVVLMLGSSCPDHKAAVDLDRVRALVRHCRHDILLYTVPIDAEGWLTKEKRAQELLKQLSLQKDHPHVHLCLYASLLLLDAPCAEELESLVSASDSPVLFSLLRRMMAQLRPLRHRRSGCLGVHSPSPLSSAPLSPVAELPIMASLMGGIAAQEIIQRITRQHVPIYPGHLLIWNGGYVSSQEIGCSVHALYADTPASMP